MPEEKENPKKTFSEEELRKKIKEHKDLLEQVTTEGKKIQERRQSLGLQLEKIVAQSSQLVGAISTLQDLLGEDKDKGNS